MQNNKKPEGRSKKANVLTPQIPFNKKMGAVKFEQVFDIVAIKKAEEVFEKRVDEFKMSSVMDFVELKKCFDEIDPKNIISQNYENIFRYAFSIKARAEIGGIALATEVARIVYEYCDKAANTLPADGYRFLRLAVGGLDEIFSGKFDVNDKEKCDKLLSGLKEISKKYL